MTRRNLKIMPPEPVRATIESLDHDGRGVARIDGKATFIEGALPGEQVLFRYLTQRKRYDEGVLHEIISPSHDRVEPRCPHFALCGGCSLQHLAPAAQISAKEKILLDNLKHIGNVFAAEVLPPLRGPVWGYRRRARLGAKYVIKKEAQFLGFREKRSGYLAELTRCEVLQPAVGERIMELRALLRSLDAYQRIPQVELAAGDDALALVFRTLDPLNEEDERKLVAFGLEHGFFIYLQPGGPQSVYPLWPPDARLSYRLPDYDVELEFSPTNFTQVNGELNRMMIKHALDLLAPEPQGRVLDLFCGLGNFTLPLARCAGEVVGVEGEAGLVARARENAARNGLGNAVFHAVNLADPGFDFPGAETAFDAILIDPPRAGALEVVQRIGRWRAREIVYVSCNPATLARDAAELVHRQGYRLTHAGVMDMFPHTTHVECIARFAR